MIFESYPANKTVWARRLLDPSPGLLSGCAGAPQRVPSDAARTYAPPPSGPPMYKGRVVNVQKFLPVRSDPSISATEMGKLKPGDTLTIKEEQGEWYAIAAPDENSPQLQGWVMQKYVEKGRVDCPAATASGGSTAFR